MSLEKTFNKAKEVEDKKRIAYETELTEKWNQYLAGAKVVIEKLSFLPARFKVQIICDSFSIKECRNSSFPRVQLMVGRSLTHITKFGAESDKIGVNGLGLFPLNGESHTFESFIKKIAPY